MGFFAAIARLFGMGSEQKRRNAQLRQEEEQIERAVRDNHEAMENLKREIRTLEARAISSKKELDKSAGDSQRIVVGQIEQIFREIKLLEGREHVIQGNLDRNQVALAKIREVLLGTQTGGVTEDQMEDLALDVEEVNADMKHADKVAASLEKERYERPVRVEEEPTDDLEERKAHIDEAARQKPALSPDIERRLKQLEAAEE